MYMDIVSRAGNIKIYWKNGNKGDNRGCQQPTCLHISLQMTPTYGEKYTYLQRITGLVGLMFLLGLYRGTGYGIYCDDSY
jgi:hypothetical protein